MAGAVVERELSRRSSSVRFTVATEADDAAIRRLLRENPMPGAISLSFEREPDYFRGANIGSYDQTIVAYAGSRLVCMGRCSHRACWINGLKKRVGYLAELRMGASARGKFHILRDGYSFFHTLQVENPSELYFTSIAADNDRARALLERGAGGLPAYRFLTELATLLIAVRRRPDARKLRIEHATSEHLPELLRILNNHAQRHQLTAAWSEKNLLALKGHDLPLDRFLLAFDENDKILAAGALWDQRAFRQIVIRGYDRALSLARPFANLAHHFFGTPRMPQPGSALAHAFISPLAFAPGAEASLPDFVEAFFPLAAQLGIEFLTLALSASDARLPLLRRRFSTRIWTSRLYRVDWPEQPRVECNEISESAFLPDVALL